MSMRSSLAGGGYAAQVPGASSSRSASGSTRAPWRRVPQWRWGPVARPVAPTLPTTSARSTTSPSATAMVGQVREHGIQPAPVVQDHGPSREEQVAGQRDNGRGGSHDRCTGRTTEVHAGVRASGLPVEDAARAKGVPRRCAHGRLKRPDAFAPGRLLEEGVKAFGLGQDAVDFGWRRIHVRRGDAKLPGGESLRCHGERVGGGQRRRVERLDLDAHPIGAGSRVHVETDETRPGARPGRSERDLLIEHPRPSGPRRRRAGARHGELHDLAGLDGARKSRNGEPRNRLRQRPALCAEHQSQGQEEARGRGDAFTTHAGSW